MMKFAYVLAAVTCLTALPAMAETAAPATDAPIVLAQSLRIDTGRRGVVIRERHRHAPAFRARDRGCRMITVRERRGNTMIVRKIRRC
jgi:hypothetical protein